MADAKFTPGPWGWFGNANSKHIYLATKHSGRTYVMDFKRWGTNSAQPRFHPEGKGMVPAKDLITFEVGNHSVVGVDAAKEDTSVYRFDIDGISNPDAHLIATAPELYEALMDARYSLYGNGPGSPKIDAALAKARGEA